MIVAGKLRLMDEEELEQKLRELKEELFNLRFQHATGQLDNQMRIKEARRDIARVCTVMTERRYSIHPEAFEEAAMAPAFAPAEVEREGAADEVIALEEEWLEEEGGPEDGAGEEIEDL